jgi:DNA-binding response OmpR family regulator
MPFSPHSPDDALSFGTGRDSDIGISSLFWIERGCHGVRLTEKETSILRYLYRAGQRPVSRETLLQEVWGYNSGVTTHTLETHIYRLRQKIEKDAAAPAILVTEAGGYKLVP